MPAVEKQKVLDLSRKLWTFAVPEVRAYSHCLWVENADYSLTSSDENFTDAEDDWLTYFAIGITPDNPGSYDLFSDKLPIRCAIMLRAIISFGAQIKEYDDITSWASSRYPAAYARAKGSISEAVGSEDDTGGPAVRLALYLLKSSDLGCLTGHSRLLIESEPLANSWLSKIGTLTSLQALSLSGSTPIAGELSALSALQQLQALDLSDTDIANPDIGELASLSALSWLNLRGTSVNAGVVNQLRKLSRLADLILPKDRFDDAGYASIQASMPDCTIRRE